MNVIKTSRAVTCFSVESRTNVSETPTLTMETEPVSETLVFDLILKQLIA